MEPFKNKPKNFSTYLTTNQNVFQTVQCVTKQENSKFFSDKVVNFKDSLYKKITGHKVAFQPLVFRAANFEEFQVILKTQ